MKTALLISSERRREGQAELTSSGGDLSADVCELSDEGEDEVVLLVERLVRVGDVSFLRLCQSLHGLLRNFGHAGGDEENVDEGSCAGDSEVDVLHVGQVVGVAAAEEGVRGDQRAGERGNTVPALAELQAACGGSGVADDGSIGVGSGFQGSKTACNHEGADLVKC